MIGNTKKFDKISRNGEEMEYEMKQNDMKQCQKRQLVKQDTSKDNIY